MPHSALILGDLHMPYHDEDTVAAAVEAARDLKPDIIVQIGDLYDEYCFSRYPRNTSKDTPKQEMLQAKTAAAILWKQMQKASPRAVCYQLLGNHDIRLHKRIMEKLPELYDLLDFDGLFSFAGVKTLDSDRDILTLKLNGQELHFHHGFLSKLGDHVRYFQASCVVGHSHRPGVVYEPIHGKLLYELNVGYMGDPTSHVFKYGATVKQKWGRGYGIIDESGPRFVSTEG